MPAARTQIYLTPEQRRRLDIRRKRERRSLAELVREAIDAYLEERDSSGVEAAIDAAFGASPDFAAPPRVEWEHRLERVYRGRRCDA